MNYFFEGKPITADKRVMILSHHHSDGTTLPPFIRQAPCTGLEATPSLHSQHKDKFYSFSESMKHLVFHFESWQMTETNGLMNLAYCPLQIRWAKSKNLCFHSLFAFSFLPSFCFLSFFFLVHFFSLGWYWLYPKLRLKSYNHFHKQAFGFLNQPRHYWLTLSPLQSTTPFRGMCILKILLLYNIQIHQETRSEERKLTNKFFMSLGKTIKTNERTVWTRCLLSWYLLQDEPHFPHCCFASDRTKHAQYLWFLFPSCPCCECGIGCRGWGICWVGLLYNVCLLTSK